jgi:hypothetical protein
VTLESRLSRRRKFPPAESPGVLVLTAPNENGLAALLKRLDRDAFRAAPDGPRCRSRGTRSTCTWTGAPARPLDDDRDCGRRSGPARSHHHRRIAGASTASRIAAVNRRRAWTRPAPTVVDASQCYVVPGFIDVHVHGSDGLDVFESDAGGGRDRRPHAGVRRHRLLSDVDRL